MSFTIDIAWLLTVFLVATRLAPLFIAASGFGSVPLPATARILLILAAALTMTSMLGIRASIPTNIGFLIGAFARELLLGGLFAFGISAVLSALLVAGRLIELQMGVGIASAIDSTFRAPASVLGEALQMCGIAVFFLADGHHQILRAIGYSFEKLPPGTPFDSLMFAEAASQFTLTFSFGLALAAPVVASLFLVDVGLAVMARTMPQVNVFVLSFSLKIAVGLSVLALSLSFMTPVLLRMFRAIDSYWGRLISING